MTDQPDSEVTGGEIHRRNARSSQTSEWLTAGAHDRSTARGIIVDAAAAGKAGWSA